MSQAGQGSNSTNPTGSTNSTGSTGKTQSKVYHGVALKPPKPYLAIPWYTLTAGLGLIIVINLAQKAFYLRRRHVWRKANKAAEQAGLVGPPPPPPYSGWSGSVAYAIPAAVQTAFHNVAYHTALPTWLTGLTMNDTFWSWAYTGMVVGFSFYGSHGVLSKWANQAGMMTYAQMPFVIGLVGKNNVISWLTGISYEKLHFLHRAAGRALFVTGWLHVGGRLAVGEDTSLADIKEQTYVQWGIVAIICSTFLTILSFRAVRNLAYEAFLISHIVFAVLYLIGCYYHWEKAGYWLYGAFVLWFLDRFARFFWVIYANRLWLQPSSKRNGEETMVEVLREDTIRLSMKRPGFNWSAGQHVYVMMPGVSKFPLESHPFTIANVPNTNKSDATHSQVQFIIRVRSGFTKKILSKTTSDSGAVGLTTWLDGPYGICNDFSMFDTVILISGGSGITFSVSHLVDLIQRAKRGVCDTRCVRMVWMIRNREHWKWIESLVTPHLDNLPAHFKVSIEIHVTSYTTHEPENVLEKISTITHSHAHHLSHLSSPCDNTSSDSGSGESTNDHDHDLEKTDMEKDGAVDDDNGLALGKTEGKMNGILSWHHGRANLDEILEETALDARGKVAVSVCGPTTMLTSARKSVKKISSVSAVLKGGPTFEYYNESFGW